MKVTINLRTGDHITAEGAGKDIFEELDKALIKRLTFKGKPPCIILNPCNGTRILVVLDQIVSITEEEE